MVYRMKKFLITGIGGFVGSYFWEYLEKQPEKSIVLGLDMEPESPISAANFSYQQMCYPQFLLPGRFGLAIVEGARHGKPLILRDLPVFREIAGEHPTYFHGLEPQALVDCIEQWLEDFKKGRAIPSTGIKTLTWEESAKMLLSRLPRD